MDFIYNKIKTFISLIRPKHWVKNTFVITPLIFSLKFNDPVAITKILIAFVAFCLLASAIYILNDIFDKEKDRNHPTKKLRPIANNEISIKTAYFGFILLSIISLSVAFFINLKTFIVFIIYFILTNLYSIKFKKLVIFDAFFIALGFVLRVYAGAFAIEVPVSHWIALTTLFISLFLAFGKRRSEYMLINSLSDYKELPKREVLNFYNETLLNIFIIISLTLTIMMYTLYTISPDTISRFHHDNFIYTVPIVVYGVFRYLYLIFVKSNEDDVTEIVLKDKLLLFTIVFWGLSIIFLIYFGDKIKYLVTF